MRFTRTRPGRYTSAGHAGRHYTVTAIGGEYGWELRGYEGSVTATFDYRAETKREAVAVADAYEAIMREGERPFTAMSPIAEAALTVLKQDRAAGRV